MNNRFLNIFTIIASSSLFVAGCSEDSPFETPPAAGETPLNAGVVSHTNFTVTTSDIFPAVVDLAAGTFSADPKVDISVKIGDLDNQLLTDEHTVFFKTEWGLIEPSCTTENGVCSVTWETSNFDYIPSDYINTVTAWTVGEESFTDTNGNGKFDDADTTFNDLEEPFVDANLDSAFNAGDKIIDVVSSNDPTGINDVHDIGDTFLNSPNCTHSSLCSTRTTTYIWGETILILTGPP